MNTGNDPYGDPQHGPQHDPVRDPYREWDSAYVLGALSVDERLAYEGHLETCDACSSAVRDLAGVPGILGKLGVDDALAIRDQEEAGGGAAGPGAAEEESRHDPGDPVELHHARVLRALARQERTRRRHRVIAFAASCALFAALGAGAATMLRGPEASPGKAGGHAPATVVMQPVGSSDLHAALTVAGKPWGTRLDWSCSYKERAWGRSSGSKAAYELVVTDKSGKRSVVATWKGAGGSAEHLSASSKSSPDEIRSVGIRLAGSHRELAERSL